MRLCSPPEFEGVGQRAPRLTILGRITQMIPTLLVMASLAGLGYFGHQYGWKIPKFAELTGDVGMASSDWCEEHGVPESVCVECDPYLMPAGPDYDRCEVHGQRKELTGQLSWISTAADRQTRMVQVRAELPNSVGQLRDETFGTGRVVLREEQNAFVVPREAIHGEGCCVPNY